VGGIWQYSFYAKDKILPSRRKSAVNLRYGKHQVQIGIKDAK
jgi:hypothetical protein